MAHASWLEFFPLAYQTLVVDLADGHTCEEYFEEIVKEFDEHITWLHEIPGEIMEKFSVKSTKFNQLPKTPSVKIKAPRKTRRKVETIPENDENMPLDLLPKKLEFDNDINQSESEAPSRPKRSCRNKTSTYVDEKPVRSTRQSRKPLPKQNCDIKQIPAVIPKEKVPVATDDSNATSGKESVKAVNLDLKKTASPATVNNAITNNSSPSVKDRANAYENMLKTKHTPNSPLKTKRGLTPNAASPNFTAATISSQAKASPNLSSVKSKGSKARGSRRSSNRRLSRRSSASHSEKKKVPAKPLRSKLRLNKHKPQADDEQKENIEEVAHEIVGITGQEQETETLVTEGTEFAETQKDDSECEDGPASADVNMNETQVVVTEVFELFNDGKKAELKELEVVKTKTTLTDKKTALPATKAAPAVPASHRCSSDQGFDEGDPDASSESSESNTNLNGTFTKAQPTTEVQGRSTRTRTKKVHGTTDVASSSVCMPFENQKTHEPIESPHNCSKSTRTRTRAMKAKVENEKETVEVECERATRSRQRKVMEEVQAQNNCVRDVSVLKPVAPTQAGTPTEAAPFRSTRSKMRKVEHSVVDGKDDEVITGSPAIKSPTAMRLQKKRLVEERGNSPRPKRSCVDETSHLESLPMSTSSPVQLRELDKTVDSMNNSILSPVRQRNRPYLFNSAQKKTNGFLNRTPGFGNNTKVLTFFGSAPSHRNNGTLTSFLKRNTPPPKNTYKDIQEEKKQRLLEKESKDNERIQRAAEARRQRLKEQKRCRDERLKKVAEQREMKERRERELKEQIKRKHEDKAASKEKLLEEKLKAENEKQRQRMKKQMEADARRRHEEEERIKKLQEQEEDARRQVELMQRKREYEELVRKRQMAEEKRRFDEKMAEKEQKKLEEITLKRKRDEEREREAERMKHEREKQMAQEKAERERIEREKREERERKIREAAEKERVRMEQDMLKEKQRLKDLEEARRQQAKVNEMQKLITQHNQQIKSSVASLNTTQTVNKGSNLNSSTNSYQITPASKKVYKPSENPNDYGVDEKESDDSTDDESEPKKRIPDWATWSRLDLALIKQDANPPDVDAIFRTKYLKPLDLHCVFPRSNLRHKFNNRTSSAFWSSPPVKSRPKF